MINNQIKIGFSKCKLEFPLLRLNNLVFMKYTAYTKDEFLDAFDDIDLINCLESVFTYESKESDIDFESLSGFQKKVLLDRNLYIMQK